MRTIRWIVVAAGWLACTAPEAGAQTFASDSVVGGQALTSRETARLAVSPIVADSPPTDVRSNASAVEDPERSTATIVRARRDRRSSIIGAVIGASAGAFLGAGLAINFAQRPCGSSCSDERVLVWGSAIGIPVAGGIIGYYLPRLVR